MRALATDIRNSADEAGDFEVVAMFEDYVRLLQQAHLVRRCNAEVDSTQTLGHP